MEIIKKLSRLILLNALLLYVNVLCAQSTSIIETYAETIPTQYDNANDGLDHDAICNGSTTTIAITLPEGNDVNVTNIAINYTMTANAAESAYMSDQRSKIYFQNNDIEEQNWSSGIGDMAGTHIYSRDIDIANGTYTGGTILTFEMWALRVFEGTEGCNTSVNKVDPNSWTIEVIYENDYEPVSKVGINTLTPEQSIDIAGKIKIGNDTEAPVAGTIRWNEESSDFEGYDGVIWRSLTNKATGGDFLPGSPGVPNINEQEGILSSNTVSDDLFGHSIAMNGDYAVIGAPNYDSAAYSNIGRAYIFKRNGNRWVEQQIIEGSEGVTFSSFGSSVDIDEDYIIIGANGTMVDMTSGQGVAYIFKKSGENWVEEDILVASDGAEFDYFGFSVSISGNYALVGAYNHDTGGLSNKGKAYVYKRTGDDWQEEAIITDPSVLAFINFGRAVSISGNYAVIGAHKYNVLNGGHQGRAFIYKRTGTSWLLEEILNPSDGIEDLNFGRSVDINGDYAIIGAHNPLEDHIQGKAYIYKRSGNSWLEEAILIPTDGESSDQFGVSVAISDDYAVIGAYFHNTNGNLNQGKAYLYKQQGNNWTKYATLTAEDGAASDRYGKSVALTSAGIMVGAYLYDNADNQDEGKVYYIPK